MIEAMRKENIKEEKVAEKFSIISNRISDHRLKPRGCAASPRRLTADGNADRRGLCAIF